MSHRILHRTTMSAIALWVITVQFCGIRLDSDRVLPLAKSESSLVEFELEDTADGEDHWRSDCLVVVVIDVDDAGKHAAQGDGGVRYAEGEWATHWSRPPPRV